MTIGPKHSKEDVARLAALGFEKYEERIEAGDDEVAARYAAYRRIGRETSDRFFRERGNRAFRELQKKTEEVETT